VEAELARLRALPGFRGFEARAAKGGGLEVREWRNRVSEGVWSSWERLSLEESQRRWPDRIGV
jgi:hypothetical protein